MVDILFFFCFKFQDEWQVSGKKKKAAKTAVVDTPPLAVAESKQDCGWDENIDREHTDNFARGRNSKAPPRFQKGMEDFLIDI